MISINVVVPAELTEQQVSYTNQIAEVDSQILTLNEQRSAAVMNLFRISKVIAILTGEEPIAVVTTASGRRPMSEEGKRNIREGLLRSAAAKKAAASVPAAPEPVQTASVPEPVAATTPAAVVEADAPKPVVKKAGK
jgi:hypothetical protein